MLIHDSVVLCTAFLHCLPSLATVLQRSSSNHYLRGILYGEPFLKPHQAQSSSLPPAFLTIVLVGDRLSTCSAHYKRLFNFLLLNTLHQFCTMLITGSSAVGELTFPGLHGYRVLAGWGRPAGVPLSVPPKTQVAHSLSIRVVPNFCIVYLNAFPKRILT